MIEQMHIGIDSDNDDNDRWDFPDVQISGMGTGGKDGNGPNNKKLLWNTNIIYLIIFRK